MAWLSVSRRRSDAGVFSAQFAGATALRRVLVVEDEGFNLTDDLFHVTREVLRMKV